MLKGVKVDLSSFDQGMRKFQKQTPFATALALTRIAKASQEAATKQIDKDIDKPTPFTKKAVGIKPASKMRQVSLVFLKDKQAQYLQYQVKGGTRRPEPGKPIIIAHHKQRNKYGNLPRNKLRRLRDSGQMVVFNDGMIAKRTKTRIIPIAFQSKQADYKPRYDFYGSIERKAKQVARAEMAAAIQQAIKSARRG